MTGNKPSRHQRGSMLLAIFFTSFFSILAIAQPANRSDFNAKNISGQMVVIHQKLLNKNNNYEDLTEIMHSINLLKSQINTCITTGQNQLKKISPLLNESKKSKAIIQNVPSYDYLLSKEKKNLADVEFCNFLNYKIEELFDVATDKINHVSKLKILKKIPAWGPLLRNSLLNIHPSIDSAYQQSGIKQLNKTHWFGLAITLLLAWMFALFLRSNNKQTTPISSVNRDYIPYILPVGLICIYLNISLSNNYPTPAFLLAINALAFYAVAMFLVRIYFIIGMTKRPSPHTLGISQFILALLTNGYVMTIQMLYLKNIPISLSFVDYIHSVYILIALRIIIACVAGLKPWFTEKLVITIQKRVCIVATLALVGYISYVVFRTLSFTPAFFALMDALYLSVLNIAYSWLIWPFVEHWIHRSYRKRALFILKTLCLSSIIAAWCGYHYLAKALIPNLIITAVIIRLILDVYQVFSQIYHFLTDPTQDLSKKLYYFLGLKANNKLIELYIMRFAFNVSAIMLGTLSIIEIWGGTRYQVLSVFNQFHEGYSILGANIRPTMLLRAVTTFCLILLLGKALSTYIIRKQMINEEKHAQVMMFSLVRYLTFTIGILVSLYIAGINLKNIVVVAGALSVGLGFGLQSFARDFISGLIIMVNKPIKIGDHIEVGDRNRNEGFIKRIGALSTQLHTLSHSDVIIPNSEIITKVITNFTFHSNALSRINITVKLDKNSDFNLAKQLLLNIATRNPNVVQEEPYQPNVLFELYDLNLWCVIKDVNKKDIVISDLNLEIAQDLKDLLATEL